LATERSLAFSATREVSWSIVEGDAGGIIDASGRYTAPNTVGVYHVIATPLDPMIPPTRAKVTVVPRELEVLAGSAGGYGLLDGVGMGVRLAYVDGMVGDGLGNVYTLEQTTPQVRDELSFFVRKLVVANGEVSTIGRYRGALDTDEADESDGPPGVASMLIETRAPPVYQDGMIYVGDRRVLRSIDVSTGEIRSIAGRFSDNRTTVLSYMDGVGTEARFNKIRGLAIDTSGHLWVSDEASTIRRVSISTGEVTTVAGQASMPGSAVGIGSDARFNAPSALGWSSTGKLLVMTRDDLRQVDPMTFEVSIVTDALKDSTLTNGTQLLLDTQTDRVFAIAAGAPIAVLTPDGQVENGAFGYGFDPFRAGHFTLDSSGRNFVFSVFAAGHIGYYPIDAVQHPPRVLDVPLAGSRPQHGSSNGNGPEARFYEPFGIALTEHGDLLVADRRNSTVRKIDGTTGYTTTLAGSPRSAVAPDYSHRDGIGPAAALSPESIVADGAGHAFVSGASLIRRIDLTTSEVTTVAGRRGEIATGVRDGTIAEAGFSDLKHLTWDGQHTLYVIDHDYRRVPSEVTSVVRKIDLEAGTVSSSPIPASRFVRGIAALGDGQLYVITDEAGPYWSRVHGAELGRLNFATGEIEFIAGGGSFGFADGQGSAVRFGGNVQGIYPGADGRLYVADPGNHAVRRFDPKTGAVSTLLGDPLKGGVVLGPAPGGVNNPYGVAYGADGQLFVSDIAESVILVAR